MIKLFTGNPGRRPLNANEPKPLLALPMPPPHLSGEAMVEWDRVSEDLYRLGILTEIDRAVLAAYCQSYGRWVQAERAIAEMAKTDILTQGLQVKGVNGKSVQNPLIALARRSMADMTRYGNEFGLTPSSRSRVRATPPGGNGSRGDKYLT